MASVESKATRHIWGKIGLIMGGKKIGVFKLPLLGMLDSMEKRSISAVNHRAVVPAGLCMWSWRRTVVLQDLSGQTVQTGQ